MKKILNILLASMLIVQIGGASVVETCTTTTTSDFFPAGDSTGKSVMTEREMSKDCNLTIEAQGPCIAWNENKQKFGLDPSEYKTYRSQDNEGALGSLFATMGAYDQLEHLWSGWHGYCEEGLKTNFDWASDPMYWASLAMSVAMDYATAGADTGAGSTEFGQASNEALTTATDAAQAGLTGLFKSLGVELTENMAKCLVSTGIDMAFYGVGKALEDGDSPSCDPIDEFCEEEEQIKEEDIFTMTEEEYNNLLTEHPEAADYLVIIDQQGSVLSVRYINVSEMDGIEGASEEEMQEAKEKMADMQTKIELAMMAGKLAYCGVSGNASGPAVEGGNSGDGRSSLENGISTAISAIPATYLGPYGPLIKGATQVLLSVATSFKDVDTCSNHDDAVEAGTRHEHTNESLEFDLCHLSSKLCAEEKFLSDGCALTGYNYCCYDQLLTKVLVEQIKAQLGRDWAHCTGISVKDLKFVSFRECDDADRNANGGTLIDGASQVNTYGFPGSSDRYYDPDMAYQKVRKCIDMEKFKESITKTFNENIDMSDFKDAAKNLKVN